MGEEEGVGVAKDNNKEDQLMLSLLTPRRGTSHSSSPHSPWGLKMDQGHQNQSKFQSPKEVIIMQCFTDNIRTSVAENMWSISIKNILQLLRPLCAWLYLHIYVNNYTKFEIQCVRTSQERKQIQINVSVKCHGNFKTLSRSKLACKTKTVRGYHPEKSEWSVTQSLGQSNWGFCWGGKTQVVSLEDIPPPPPPFNHRHR